MDAVFPQSDHPTLYESSSNQTIVAGSSFSKLLLASAESFVARAVQLQPEVRLLVVGSVLLSDFDYRSQMGTLYRPEFTCTMVPQWLDLLSLDQLFESGEFGEAKKCVETAIELDKQAVESWLTLAELHGRVGQRSQVQACYDAWLMHG